MLLRVLGVAGAVVGAFCALLGWSLARISHASDEHVRHMLEEHVGSRDTQHDL